MGTILSVPIACLSACLVIFLTVPIYQALAATAGRNGANKPFPAG